MMKFKMKKASSKKISVVISDEAQAASQSSFKAKRLPPLYSIVTHDEERPDKTITTNIQRTRLA